MSTDTAQWVCIIGANVSTAWLATAFWYRTQRDDRAVQEDTQR